MPGPCGADGQTPDDRPATCDLDYGHMSNRHVDLYEGWEWQD